MVEDLPCPAEGAGEVEELAWREAGVRIRLEELTAGRMMRGYSLVACDYIGVADYETLGRAGACKAVVCLQTAKSYENVGERS